MLQINCLDCNGRGCDNCQDSGKVNFYDRDDHYEYLSKFIAKTTYTRIPTNGDDTLADWERELLASKYGIYTDNTAKCPCCQADMDNSDHCPRCGCEEYESTCSMKVNNDNCTNCDIRGTVYNPFYTPGIGQARVQCPKCDGTKKVINRDNKESLTKRENTDMSYEDDYRNTINTIHAIDPVTGIPDNTLKPGLNDFESAARFLMYHMDTETRRKMMAEMPGVYNRIVGREVVQVTVIDDGRKMS